MTCASVATSKHAVGSRLNSWLAGPVDFGGLADFDGALDDLPGELDFRGVDLPGPEDFPGFDDVGPDIEPGLLFGPDGDAEPGDVPDFGCDAPDAEWLDRAELGVAGALSPDVRLQATAPASSTAAAMPAQPAWTP